MYYNTTGSSNAAIGSNTLYKNITGRFNVAVGTSALFNNNSDQNTAVGINALYSNTTGSLNTAIGNEALYTNQAGDNNVAIGNSSLNMAFGTENTAVGANSLGQQQAANFNTGIGLGALFNNINGSFNTALGNEADATGDVTNATSIGNGAVVDANNKVRIGNTSVTSIGGQVSWTNFSDGRYKKNIKEDVKGIEFINSLRPITYTLDINGLNEYYSKGKKQSNTNEKAEAEMQKSNDAASKNVYSGFIAQEVEAAAKKMNYDFSGVDKPQTKDGLYGLRYSDFVVPLVKAVQELSKTNDDKDAKINDLQKQIDDLKAMIVSNQLTGNSQQSTALSSASLQQNIPNPFTNTTTINYTLPQKFSSAQIIIIDKSGKTLKAINIASRKGNVKIDASTLASGAYQYSLMVDGRLIDTKQMVLIK